MSAKLWAVVKREYVERVRTKSFVIGTILGPLIMGGMMILPSLAARSTSRPLAVAVLDRTGALGSTAEQALRAARFDDRARFEVQPAGDAPPVEREARLREAVLAKALDGYVLIPEDALASGSASYYGRNVANRIDLRTMERALNDVIVGARLSGVGLDPARVRDLTRELDLKTIRLSDAGEREDGGSALIFALILLTILYASILMWGQVVMTSVIEEKSSRVVEVMASGVSSTTLLGGKLLGVGGAGLTQFLVWSLSLLGVSLALAGPLPVPFEMPEVSLVMLVSFVLFFILGFYFYAALYAALGASVNTVQEAQSLAFPVMLPLIAGMVCFPAALEAPDGPLAVALSMVPGISPLIMFLRIVVLTPPLWQIALSLTLMGFAIGGVLWMSARIYRVGILMYGKKPTFPELWRWTRRA